jgi:methionyl-tRNA formyltransferase
VRIVFAGSPITAVPTLDAVIAAGHDVVCVVTRPDALVGRRRVRTPSAVASAAEERGLPVLRAARLDADATNRILATQPDLGVIVAYGGLVREPLLSGPTNGWINLHFSLLPAWRGASPVQHSIAHRSGAGATVFQLVPELDAGPVWTSRERVLTGQETTGDLLAELAESGAHDVVTAISAIAAGERPVEQSGEPSFAPKLTAADGRIDWTLDAPDVIAHVRAMTPEPGAHTTVAEARVKVLEVADADESTPALRPGLLSTAGRDVIVGTGSVPLRLLTVQPAGKRPMPAADWWRGARPAEEEEVTAW